MVGFWFPPRSAYMCGETACVTPGKSACVTPQDTESPRAALPEKISVTWINMVRVTPSDPQRACVTPSDPQRACVTSLKRACVTPDETDESCAARARTCAEGIVRAACDAFEHGKRWEGHERPLLRAALRTIEECENLIRSLYRPQDVQAEVSAMIDERANGREDER